MSGGRARKPIRARASTINPSSADATFEEHGAYECRDAVIQVREIFQDAVVDLWLP